MFGALEDYKSKSFYEEHKTIQFDTLTEQAQYEIVVYISGLVLGVISMVFALLGVAVLITYSPQNGIILMILAFLISPFGLPKAAIWMLGKVQDLKYAIQDKVYG